MSMKRKTGLGRGISSLIPDFDGLESDGNSADFFMCRIEDIVPNRFQPRKSFSEDELEKLTLSIREQGVLQPLLVRKDPKGGYELIAGERRLRAAKKADLDQVPVLIKNLTDEQMLEVSIIENVQRANLNPLEEADAYHKLITEFGYTQEMVAQKIGKNRSTIANFLRLRGLPQPVLQSLADEEISMGHARAILGAGLEESQIRTWEMVVEKGLSVRATEQLAKKMKTASETPPPDAAPEPPPHDQDFIKTLCSDLTRRINYPVAIKKKGEKGSFEIRFRDDHEFERIIELLNSVNGND